MVRVEFYGRLQEIADCHQLQMEEAPTDLAALLDHLEQRFPDLGFHRKGLAFAINDELARPSDPLPAGATVALLPPVSGG